MNRKLDIVGSHCHVDEKNLTEYRLNIFNKLMIKDFIIRSCFESGLDVRWTVETRRECTLFEVGLACSWNGYIPFGGRVEQIEENKYKVWIYKD